MGDVFGKTLSGSRSLDVDDLTIGTITLSQLYSSTPYSLTLPSAQGAANTVLINNGSGNLTWAVPSVGPAPVTGVLPVLNGGTGVTQSTGTTAVVLSNSPTLLNATLQNNANFNLASTGILSVSSSATTALNAVSFAMAGSSAISMATAGAGAIALNTTGGGVISIGTQGIGSVNLNAAGTGSINADVIGLGEVSLTAKPIPGINKGTISVIGSTGAIVIASTIPTTGFITIDSVTGITVNAPVITASGATINLTGAVTTVSLTTGALVAGAITALSGTFAANVSSLTLSTGALGAGLITSTGLATGLIVATGLGITGSATITDTLNTAVIRGNGRAEGDLDIFSARNLYQECANIGSFLATNYLNLAGGFGSNNDLYLSSTRDTFLAALPGASPGPTSIILGAFTPPTTLTAQAQNIVITAALSIIMGGNSYPLGPGNNGDVLTTNGAGVLSWQRPYAPTAGIVTSVTMTTPGGFLLVDGATSGGPITGAGVFTLSISGALPIANGGTGQTTATGSGALVLSTAPTFLTDLSTPQIKGSGTSGNLLISSGNRITLTAATPITIGANTFPASTGSSGQVLASNGSGTMIWGTPSVASVTGVLPVANGGTGQTTATGTGSLVLRTTPTFLTSITTPRMIGSGTSNDLDIASARNITLTGGVGNAIFLNTALYARNKIVGDTGGDFIIENPSSFIFLNPGYSVRTGGIALHVESANNQTFTGTAIGDQTIRTDSNCWIGPGVGGAKLQLIGPSGVFTNAIRADTKIRGAGLCNLLATPAPQGEITFIQLAQYDTGGISLTPYADYLRNEYAYSVTVKVYFSCARGTGDTTGVDQFYLGRSTSSASYSFKETGAYVRQSGYAVLILAPLELLTLKYFQNSIVSSVSSSTGSSDVLFYTLEAVL